MQFIVELQASQPKRRDPIGSQGISQGFTIIRQHRNRRIILGGLAQPVADRAQLSSNIAAQVGFHGPIRLKNGLTRFAQAVHLAGLVWTTG